LIQAAGTSILFIAITAVIGATIFHRRDVR
jgi:hypothetical protein